MADMTYVLDCEGLSKAALGDPRMKARLKDAYRTGIRVVTTSMTLVEAYHDRIRRPAWDWAMSGVVVEPVTQDVAEEAIRLLRATGLHGHKYAIDAVLAVIADRQPGLSIVFTSDRDDMEKLCGAGAVVKEV
ncbi:hypothetical protein ACWD7Y_00280 [Streptomyces drozdowiczii]